MAAGQLAERSLVDFEEQVRKEMEEKGTSDAADLSYEYLTVEERIALFGERNYERYEKRFETR